MHLTHRDLRSMLKVDLITYANTYPEERDRVKLILLKRKLAKVTRQIAYWSSPVEQT